MVTSGAVITNALHLFGIVDQVESPTPADMAACVPVLSDMMRNEHADGAAQYLMGLTTATLPVGVSGSVYSFSIGTAQSSYLVQKDAVGMKALWMNDINMTVNRETRQAPKADVVRTTYPGIITKWHTERQVDGSVLVYAWQPPRFAAAALIEYGGRMPALTDLTGGDTINIPPEGIHDVTLLFGRRICQAYGRTIEGVGIIGQDAEAVNKRWRDWARGQQWLRFVRA